MTVVINEFEVVVEPQQPPTNNGRKPPSPPPPPPPLNPVELMAVQRRHTQRLARVWAT